MLHHAVRAKRPEMKNTCQVKERPFVKILLNTLAEQASKRKLSMIDILPTAVCKRQQVMKKWNTEVKKWKYKTHKKASDMWVKPSSMKAKLSNMDTELKIGATKLSIRDIGNMDFNRDTVNKIGYRPNQHMLEDGIMASNMGKVGKHGTMAVILTVNGSLMSLKGVELISGLIKEYTLVNGKTINYMEAESLIGLTVVLTQVNIWMT